MWQGAQWAALEIWVAAWAGRHGLDPREKLLFNWVTRGCPAAVQSCPGPSSRQTGLHELQVAVHLCALAVASGPESWWHSLLLSPGDEAALPMPSMPDSEMAVIMQVGKRPETY